MQYLMRDGVVAFAYGSSSIVERGCGCACSNAQHNQKGAEDRFDRAHHLGAPRVWAATAKLSLSIVRVSAEDSFSSPAVTCGAAAAATGRMAASAIAMPSALARQA